MRRRLINLTIIFKNNITNKDLIKTMKNYIKKKNTLITITKINNLKNHLLSL